jgi:DNA (cytosine-5)-methyltransferase 1
MTTIFNEIEPYACDWLENLIEAGHIEPGIVDRRSIEEIEPDDIKDARQFHAFAGIGVWSYALQLAGWPPNRPVWTGSCPCQPWSHTGRHRGEKDDRHLWPAWFRLVRECRPPFVFGEQVSSALGRDWLGSVSADLESEGYAVAGADLPAAGLGAPHKRQRIWFFALAITDGERIRDTRQGEVDRAEGGRQDQAWQGRLRSDTGERDRDVSAWEPVQWLRCSDGKSRPTEPGLHPLADGTPCRVGRLRAYGNAIVPQVAAVFIRAAIEAIEELNP